MERARNNLALRQMFYWGKTKFPAPRFTTLEAGIKKIPKLGFLKKMVKKL